MFQKNNGLLYLIVPDNSQANFSYLIHLGFATCPHATTRTFSSPMRRSASNASSDCLAGNRKVFHNMPWTKPRNIQHCKGSWDMIKICMYLLYVYIYCICIYTHIGMIHGHDIWVGNKNSCCETSLLWDFFSVRPLCCEISFLWNLFAVRFLYVQSFCCQTSSISLSDISKPYPLRLKYGLQRGKSPIQFDDVPSYQFSISFEDFPWLSGVFSGENLHIVGEISPIEVKVHWVKIILPSGNLLHSYRKWS